jgi:hypothetical protein
MMKRNRRESCSWLLGNGKRELRRPSPEAAWVSRSKVRWQEKRQTDMWIPNKDILGVNGENNFNGFRWAVVAVYEAEELSLDGEDGREITLDRLRIHNVSTRESKGLYTMFPTTKHVTIWREVWGDGLVITKERSADCHSIMSEVDSRSLVSIVLVDITENERMFPKEIFHFIFHIMNLLRHGGRGRQGRGGGRTRSLDLEMWVGNVGGMGGEARRMRRRSNGAAVRRRGSGRRGRRTILIIKKE